MTDPDLTTPASPPSPVEPDAPADTDAPADADADAVGDARRGSSRPSAWRALALVVVIAGAAAAAAWGWSQRDGDPDPLAEARVVASEFGSAYLSFEGGRVDEAGERLLSMGTEDFVEEYESARLPSVESLFADNDVSTRAEVTDVFTTGIEDFRVRAVVFVDVDARGPEGQQRLANLSFVLELELVDGEWLVDAVAPVPVAEVVGGEEPAAPTAPTGPTETTAPTGPTAPAEPAAPSEPATPTTAVPESSPTSEVPPTTGG